MSYVKELLDEAIYKCACLTPNEENRLYKWIESLEVAKRKADEYEAKSEAFDRIVEERNRIGKLMHNKEYPQIFTDEAFWNIDDIINDTESGESNV